MPPRLVNNVYKSNFSLLISLYSAFVFFLLPLLTSAQPAEKKIIATIPPFVREGDRPQISFLFNNATAQDWSGSVQFNLIDRSTQQPVDGWFFNSLANQYFTIEPHEKHFIFFPLEIPYQFNKKASWTLAATAPKDSQLLAGPLTILPWIYEEEESTPHTNNQHYSVLKKIAGPPFSAAVLKPLRLETPVTVHTQDSIGVSLQIHLPQQKTPITIFEQWPSGTLLDSTSIRINGEKVNDTAITFFQDHFIVKWTNRSANSSLTLRYKLSAKYPGQYHFPPAMLYSSDLEKPISRSSFSSLTIESIEH